MENKVIDERSCAFIGGRNLLDGVLIENEDKRKKKSYLILKVHYEKICNSMC